MIRAVILLSLASRTAATSCCVCNGYPACSSYSGSNGGGSNDCSLCPPPPVRPSDGLGADYKGGAVDGGAVAAGVLVALVVLGGAVGGALLWRRRQRRLDTFLLDGNFDDKEDRLRLEFKASDRHSRGELHSSQI